MEPGEPPAENAEVQEGRGRRRRGRRERRPEGAGTPSRQGAEALAVVTAAPAAASMVAGEGLRAPEALPSEVEGPLPSERVEQVVAALAPAEPAPDEIALPPPAVETVEEAVPALATMGDEAAPAAPALEDVQPSSPAPMPASVELPEGMVMVETNPGRTQVSAGLEEAPESEHRRTPRSRPAAMTPEEETLVQIETRK